MTRKTLDGLMAFLVTRLTDAQYRQLMQRAVVEGMELRNYVGRRVLQMVREREALARKSQQTETRGDRRS